MCYPANNQPTADQLVTAARFDQAASETEGHLPPSENSGGSCDYYKVAVSNPTTAGNPTYVAECNDMIEALDMTYAEANMFKEIWRTAAARTLGKVKEGNTTKRGAEKILFFAKRNAIQNGVSTSDK